MALKDLYIKNKTNIKKILITMSVTIIGLFTIKQFNLFNVNKLIANFGSGTVTYNENHSTSTTTFNTVNNEAPSLQANNNLFSIINQNSSVQKIPKPDLVVMVEKPSTIVDGYYYTDFTVYLFNVVGDIKRYKLATTSSLIFGCYNSMDALNVIDNKGGYNGFAKVFKVTCASKQAINIQPNEKGEKDATKLFRLLDKTETE